MKGIKFILMGVVFLAGCATVQTRDDILSQAREIKARRDLGGPVVKDYQKLNPLPESEKLRYTAKFLGISVGTLTTTIKGKTTVQGREAYHFEMRAQNSGLFARVFKVDDRFVSYLDAEDFRVLRHEEYRHEGNYRKESIVDFDYEKGKAFFFNKVNDTRKQINIPQNLHDILTANFFFRMLDWELGDAIEVNVYADEKVYNILGLIRKKVTVNTAVKRRAEAFLLEPYVYLEGKQVEKISALGFFETAYPRIPLRGLVKTPVFGSASVTLYKIE